MNATAAVPLLLSLFASSAAASTWVVDDSGGADFTTIQAAVDAASPGDVLLVQAGSYAAFTLDRDLSILAAPGEQSAALKLPAVLTGLEGLVVTFQGFAAGLGGDGNYLATNPVHLLLR